MTLHAYNATKHEVVEVKVEPKGLKDTKAWEYLVRFVFGGVVTALVGLVAKKWGPEVAGLFLAFPAILPASLTLVAEHETRVNAAEDARGACYGAIGLGVFAVVVRAVGDAWGAAPSLALAAASWALVAFGLWALAFRVRR